MRTLVNTGVLRPIYTVQLCRMRSAYDKSTTQIVSCKSNLQLACDCRVRHKKCCRLLKHVLKPYDNRSDRQFDIVEIVYDFSMTRAARATKIACDNRKQKSYRVNRPLHVSGDNRVFKRKLISVLFGILKDNDDYLDATMITQEIKLRNPEP